MVRSLGVSALLLFSAVAHGSKDIGARNVVNLVLQSQAHTSANGQLVKRAEVAKSDPQHDGGEQAAVQDNGQNSRWRIVNRHGKPTSGSDQKQPSKTTNGTDVQNVDSKLAGPDVVNSTLQQSNRGPDVQKHDSKPTNGIEVQNQDSKPTRQPAFVNFTFNQPGHDPVQNHDSKPTNGIEVLNHDSKPTRQPAFVNFTLHQPSRGPDVQKHNSKPINGIEVLNHDSKPTQRPEFVEFTLRQPSRGPDVQNYYPKPTYDNDVQNHDSKTTDRPDYVEFTLRQPHRGPEVQTQQWNPSRRPDFVDPTLQQPSRNVDVQNQQWKPTRKPVFLDPTLVGSSGDYPGSKSDNWDRQPRVITSDYRPAGWSVASTSHRESYSYNTVLVRYNTLIDQVESYQSKLVARGITAKIAMQQVQELTEQFEDSISEFLACSDCYASRSNINTLSGVFSKLFTSFNTLVTAFQKYFPHGWSSFFTRSFSSLDSTLASFLELCFNNGVAVDTLLPQSLHSFFEQVQLNSVSHTLLKYGGSTF